MIAWLFFSAVVVFCIGAGFVAATAIFGPMEHPQNPPPTRQELDSFYQEPPPPRQKDPTLVIPRWEPAKGWEDPDKTVVEDEKKWL